ncbi:MAG TPA: OmpH family outer membrane protein [Gemmatimonadaceae bacterium]
MAKSIKVAILGALLLPAAGLVGAQTPAQSPAPKFAFVDSRVILQRAPGSAAIQAQITKERSDAQASVTKMQDSLRAMYDAYLKEQPTLTAAQKEQREKTLQQRNADFDQRVGQLDQDMQKRQFDLIQPMMAQIREVLDAIRNEDSYTFIFDVGNDPGLIVAADKNLDITERVISRLKPVSVNVTRTDSTKAPGATKPAPAGITKPPIKPPTR